MPLKSAGGRISMSILNAGIFSLLLPALHLTRISGPTDLLVNAGVAYALTIAILSYVVGALDSLARENDFYKLEDDLFDFVGALGLLVFFGGSVLLLPAVTIEVFARQLIPQHLTVLNPSLVAIVCLAGFLAQIWATIPPFTKPASKSSRD